MFLRRHSKTIDDTTYEYWTLCQTVRTEKGPRQKIVATLGKLTPEEAAPGSAAGWCDLKALLDGPGDKAMMAPRQGQFAFGPKLARDQAPAAQPLPAPLPQAPEWEMADLANLHTTRVRDFGLPWLSLTLWHRLGFPKLLAEVMPDGKEDVPWHHIAAILATARFCGQKSELGIAEHWYRSTALEDITGIPPEQINDDRLYRGLDQLGKQKEALCSHLMRRYREMFGVDYEFLIYDVTSTFFEGQANANPLAARGYSRDQRSDCKQVCIGLICTPEGLPLSYEVFAGNRTDVTTVESIVTMMEEKYGQANRVWVMDRGMVSEANIAFLRDRKARYIIGTPKAQLKAFESQLLDQEHWKEVQHGLEAKLIPHPDGKGEEQYILCRSSARAEKERAMLAKQCEHLANELFKINHSLTKHPQADLEQVGRRIGRWLGKYPAAAKVMKVTVIQGDKPAPELSFAVGLEIKTDVTKGREAFGRHGAYLLRTNCQEEDPAAVWRHYVQLTQAEAAFRTAKSDLHLRPVYHQKEDRVKAHILVCFLALAQMRVLSQWTESKGLGTGVGKILKEIGTIKSMDVVVPVKRGETTTQLTIRTVARPETATAELLVRLGLKLPTRNRILGGEPPGHVPAYTTRGEAAATKATKAATETKAEAATGGTAVEEKQSGESVGKATKRAAPPAEPKCSAEN
jgi:transposase